MPEVTADGIEVEVPSDFSVLPASAAAGKEIRVFTTTSACRCRQPENRAA
jgi:hypothetical protein